MSTPDRSVITGTGMAIGAMASVQFGAALAVHLFVLIGPIGTVSLRLLGGALALGVVTRPWRFRWTARDLRAVALFGLIFVVMNVSLYIAIDRLPLATAITIEFLGPLGVATASATSWRQRAWTVPAAGGVVLLGGSLHADDLIGVAAAGLAALGWASYILMSREMGTRQQGLAGLCLANLTAAMIIVPMGAATAGHALLDPRTIALGLGVGVMSSALPYSLDLLALRRLPAAVFGVLTSLSPAVAALAGLLILSERLPYAQLIGIAFVVMASAGITLDTRTQDPPDTRTPDTVTPAGPASLPAPSGRG